MTCETRIKSEYIAEIKDAAKNQADKKNLSFNSFISKGELNIVFGSPFENQAWGAAKSIAKSLIKSYNVDVGEPFRTSEGYYMLIIPIKKENIQQIVNVVNTNKVNTFTIPEETKQVEQPTTETKPNRIQEEIKNKPGDQLSLFNQPTTQPIKPGVKELFESNPELANQVYEALGFNIINNSQITYTDDKGNLCASNGLVTSFTKGGEWKIIKDLKNYPTHKNGGVDLTINKNGVTIKKGNTQFIAKHGLVIPKN